MSQETDKDQPLQVRLNHRILGRMPAIYAQHIIAQAQPETVLISFFEAIPPLKPGAYTAEDVEQMKELGILGECIARIAMPASSFMEAAKAISELAERIQKAAQLKEKEPPDAELPTNQTVH